MITDKVKGTKSTVRQDTVATKDGGRYQPGWSTEEATVQGRTGCCVGTKQSNKRTNESEKSRNRPEGYDQRHRVEAIHTFYWPSQRCRSKLTLFLMNVS